MKNPVQLSGPTDGELRAIAKAIAVYNPSGRVTLRGLIRAITTTRKNFLNTKRPSNAPRR